jgi:hypothetical protein
MLCEFRRSLSKESFKEQGAEKGAGMIRGNFHTHTVFCDGSNTAEEVVEQALSLGFTHLGFSGHMDPEITMDLAAYDAEIRRLQEKYKGQIDILRGVELDGLFVPGSEEESVLLGNMEYLIGSTHFIEAPSGGETGCVDDNPGRLETFCRQEFGGDYYRLAKAYYQLEAEIRERAAQSAVVPEVAVRAWLRSFRSGDISDPAFRKRLADVFLADVLVGPEDVTIVYNAKEAPYGPGDGSHSASSRGGQVTADEPVVIGPLIFFRLPRQ